MTKPEKEKRRQSTSGEPSRWRWIMPYGTCPWSRGRLTLKTTAPAQVVAELKKLGRDVTVWIAGRNNVLLSFKPRALGRIMDVLRK
jgi:hypothetical protein